MLKPPFSSVFHLLSDVITVKPAKLNQHAWVRIGTYCVFAGAIILAAAHPDIPWRNQFAQLVFITGFSLLLGGGLGLCRAGIRLTLRSELKGTALLVAPVILAAVMLLGTIVAAHTLVLSIEQHRLWMIYWALFVTPLGLTGLFMRGNTCGEASTMETEIQNQSQIHNQDLRQNESQEEEASRQQDEALASSDGQITMTSNNHGIVDDTNNLIHSGVVKNANEKTDGNVTAVT